MAGYAHCNTNELTELFGRQLSADELRDLSEIIEEQAWSMRRDNPNLEFNQSLQDAVPDSLITMQNRIQQKRREAAQVMATTVEKVRNLEEHWKADPAEGLKAIMVGSPFIKPGAKRSAAALQDAAIGKNMGRFNDELTKTDPSGGLRRKLLSGELDDEMRRAAMAIDDVDGAGVRLLELDPDAVTLARLIIKHSELSRLDFNRAGGRVERLPGRLVGQSHKQSRIRNARKSLRKQGVDTKALSDEDAWVEYMTRELDEFRSFKGEFIGEDIQPFLREKYGDFSRGDHLQFRVADTPGGRVGSGLGKERVFFFKDGVEGEIRYSKIFGEELVKDSFLGELTLIGHKEGLLDGLSPDAIGVLQTTALAAQKMARKSGKTAEKKFNKFTNHGEFIKSKGLGMDKSSLWWKEISGQNASPVENLWSTVGSALRLLQNIKFLGRATLASVVDVATVGSSFRYQGRSFFDGHAEALGTIFEPKRSSAHKQEVWEALGVGADYMNGLNHGRFSVDDSPVGTIGKMNTMFFRFNFLTQWTDNMKRGAALSNARYMGIQSSKAWGSLDPTLRDLLTTYGFDEADWKIISKVDYSQSPDGKAYLSIDSLNTLKDNAYSAKAKATNKSVDELRRELEQKLRLYHLDMVDSAVITPDAEVRALTTGGHAKGSYQRELYRAFFQFKAFPISIYKRVVRREVFGRGTEETAFLKALNSGNGEMLGTAELLTSATIMGYIALTLKDLSAGKTPRVPTTSDMAFRLFLDSMLQGGASGIYGDIVIGDALRRRPLSKGFLETLGGPTFSFLAQDVIGGISDVTYGMLTGQDGDKIATRIWGSVGRDIPLANTFWLKAALDYSFLHRVQEDLAPGSMERLNKRAEERGQRYLAPLPVGGS